MDKELLVDLYFLVLSADRQGLENLEKKVKNELIRVEGISREFFDQRHVDIIGKKRNDLLEHCIKALRGLERGKQIRCLAWVCKMANANGFMSKEEWSIIYRIYHIELKLSMPDIIAAQKELVDHLNRKNV